MKRIISIAFILTICLFSCQKTVKLDLNSTYPHLVIQGEVTDDTTGPYKVTINRTVDFYSENNFPAISGAIVKISDNQGNADSLIESSPGVYSTQTLRGKPGNTYTLTVKALDSLFIAVSTMPQPVELDSITFTERNAFGNKALYAIPNFQDPPGVANYYQFLEFLNGKQLNKTIFVFDDRLSDGRYISRTLRNDSAYLQPTDWLEVRMYCIEKPVFDYFNQLDESSGGFNSSASPTNPASNISNGALGYFSAHTIRSKTVQVY